VARLWRVLVLSALESFATVLIERGIYFYAHDRFAFSEGENLFLALGFGAAYVVGALGSHRLSRRVGERPQLVGVLLAQLAVHAGLAARPVATVVVAGTVVLGFLNGLKWPVIESYVAAGRTPARAARAVGGFNLSWSGVLLPALVVAGPLIAWRAAALFAAAGAVNLVALVLAWPLPREPVHLAPDHPERPTPAARRRLGALLVSSRWSLLSSYSQMWVLAALMPAVFARLKFEVAEATALSGVLDLMRFGSFAVLGVWSGWHFRRLPLLLVIAALPAGFFMVLFGKDLATVVAGEALFGAAAGMTYYAALYYAMVVKNASVDAGGGHEGLIGTGFAIGPAAGLAGRALAPLVGSADLGLLGGMGLLVVVCAAGAAVWLLRASPRRSQALPWRSRAGRAAEGGGPP
jgi:MFS family permease